MHGLAEAVHLHFLGVFAAAAAHGRADGQQAVEGLPRLMQHGVVGAVNEVGMEHAGFEVAVVPSQDAQQRLVGARIDFGDDLRRFAVQGLRGEVARQRLGAGLRGVIEVDLDAIDNGAQRLLVHEGRQPCDHAFCQHVLARELLQGVPGQRRRGIWAEDGGVLEGDAQQVGVELGAVLEVLLVLAVLDLVERRLGDVDVAALDDLGHLAEEEGQQQSADVRAVDVGIGHDDDAVIAQLVDVEVVLANAGSHRRDEGEDFVAGQQLFEAGLFDVEDLAAQRQDGLKLAVTALLGRAAGGIALHQIQLAQRRVLLLAVGQLSGQAQAVHHALAPGHFARFARGLAGAGGVDDLAADDLGIVRRFEQVVGQGLGHQVFHRAAHFARHQFVLGLAAELGVGHLHRQHAGQPFAHVVAADLDLGFLGQFVVVDVLVDHPGHRRTQAGEVGAAVTLGNIVGKALHGLGVAVVPLHGDFDIDVAAGFGGFFRLGVEHRGMQHGLAAIDVFDETLDSAGKGKVLLLALALVDQADLHPVVEEGQFAQALGEHFVVKVDHAENVDVRQEMHFGALLVGLAGNRRGRDGDTIDLDDLAVLQRATGELEFMHLAFAPHRQAQPLRQGIHATDTDSVQAAGHLVAVLVELAARMQFGQGDFGRAALGLMLVVHLHPRGDATPVVDHADRVVGMNGDGDVVAIPGQRLVDGVVHDLEHQVMQSRAVGGITDIHAGTLAYRLQSLEDLDGRFAVAVVAGFGHQALSMQMGVKKVKKAENRRRSIRYAWA
ncbi:hypothetical protein GALL_434870 [mine drainage metagenome]|uniref:NAD-specific glutamate dehydrogenase n=1 Tax=mine drainage metagenome TaxID=410659 RepID=A0A1J5PTA7_9ZZZZ